MSIFKLLEYIFKRFNDYAASLPSFIRLIQIFMLDERLSQWMKLLHIPGQYTSVSASDTKCCELFPVWGIYQS